MVGGPWRPTRLRGISPTKSDLWSAVALVPEMSHRLRASTASVSTTFDGGAETTTESDAIAQVRRPLIFFLAAVFFCSTRRVVFACAALPFLFLLFLRSGGSSWEIGTPTSRDEEFAVA